MATSSNAAARRSLRPHSAPNVRENLRRERERLLARQSELEQLAAPINEVAAQLAKLDAVVESRSTAAERKVEQLVKARDKKIEKLRQEFEAKIEAAKKEADSTDNSLTAEEQAQEDALLLDYARAIAVFAKDASAAELASVLGVSAREAKKTVEQAKQDLAAAGLIEIPSATTAPAAREATAAAPEPVTVAS